MSKENFKNFARIHPELASFVDSSKTTWQKLYELYDIYGENSSVWNNYFKTNTNITKTSTLSDIFNTIKNVNLEELQKGLSNIEKTIGMIEELGLGKKSTPTSTYQERPLYKYFED